MSAKLEILCTACGAESILRREAVYDGFKKSGERLMCAACGHTFAGEDDVPYKRETGRVVFTESDRPEAVKVFRDDERARNCRYCAHYVVNPFTQWCGLHKRDVEATDSCDRFTPRPPPKPMQENPLP